MEQSPPIRQQPLPAETCNAEPCSTLAEGRLVMNEQGFLFLPLGAVQFPQTDDLAQRLGVVAFALPFGEASMAG